MFASQLIGPVAHISHGDLLSEVAHERLVGQLSTVGRPARNPKGILPMQTVKIAARYTRYLLTSLATVAFGMNLN